ncbi:hypothetical protein F5Y19DRAFT_468776 [Xylariaceae sp. FL1651]|nr:hypothetical protein F5Y19DRAFT_468776 [Xylariaceae sp. FL1651]
MLSIDPALLPSLATRKALLVVDAQNDFLAEDGVLPVRIPVDLPQRIGDLAKGFRQSGGEIIWVQSEFESSRPATDEQILVSDTLGSSTAPAPVRGRRSRATPPATDSAPSPEAFLTRDAGNGQDCVRRGTPGSEMHPVIKQAVGPRDHKLVKTFYSAFRSEELLRLLRVRFVTELFICGSFTNVGVMATAIDAARYGYIITIVDDCCGSQNMGRHRTAIRQITSTTGCDTLSAARVLETIRPKSDAPERVDRGTPDDGSPTVRLRRGKRDDVASPVSYIQSSLERLSLSSQPAAADEPALQTIAQQKPPSASALQSVAGPGHPQTQGQTDRDTLAPNPRPSVTATNAAAESFDSLETPPTAISKTPKDTAAQAGPPPASNTIRKKDNSAMATSPEDKRPTESEPLCEGDTKVIYDILPEPLAHGIFERIRDEVKWQRMSHQGGEVPRLVAVQGQVDPDGSMPVYRHPADESPPLLPFTPTVEEIRRVVEAKLGHPLNHVLIQFYRHGNDYISEHSDKTLDIAPGSFIANVSLGAERVMTLRTKRQPRKDRDQDQDPPAPDELKRQVQRAPLPHNSLCQMGLATNMRWMHAIRADKRLAREKSAAELAHGGARISLTFRRIGTFLDRGGARIWGQGATGKTRADARRVINGQTPEAVRMLQAFGRENQSSEFDWARHYGAGFDVLHITAAARLFASPDPVVNMRVQMMLAEFGVGYARGSMAATAASPPPSSAGAAGAATVPSGDAPIKFVDNDDAKTAVQSQLDIMLYLQKTYGGEPAVVDDPASSASRDDDDDAPSERFRQGLSLLDQWRASSLDAVMKLLAPWETYAGEDAFIAGPTLGLADFAFWPVLHTILSSEAGAKELKLPNLLAYHERVRAREPITQMLAAATPT